MADEKNLRIMNWETANAQHRTWFVENIVFALRHQGLELDNVRPHPSPLLPERVKQCPFSNDRICFSSEHIERGTLIASRGVKLIKNTP